jgi:hypothetical protein
MTREFDSQISTADIQRAQHYARVQLDSVASVIPDTDAWLTKQLYPERYRLSRGSGVETEKSRPQFQTPIAAFAALEPAATAAEMRKQRFSALVDGICMGVGIVFILLGVLMPITSGGMLVQGLLSVIGGLVVLAVGAIVEVYHWAKIR